MKLGFLLVNVLVVATGIFVYHTLFAGERAGAPAPAEPVAAAPAERPSAHAEPQPLLVGKGLEDLAERVAVLEERLDPGAAPAAGGTRAVEAQGRPAAEGTSRPADVPSAGLEVPDVGDPERPRFDPPTLERFRAYMEEVDRIRQEERRREGIKSQLNRMGVALAPQQEEAVIAVMLRNREKVADTMRSLRDDDGATREDREAAFRELRAEYEKELNQVAPAAEVEKILQGSGNLLGGGFRGREAPRPPDGR